MQDIETRNIEDSELRIDIECRDTGDSPKITGYAARFGQWSSPIAGIFRERIDPAAFNKTVQESDIRALWNHNPDYVLGRNKAGTLSLSTNEHGLKMEISPPDTEWARDLVTSIKRGDVSGASFGFEAVKDTWNDSMDERTLNEVKLFDVSPVTYPAYPASSVKVRSLLESAGVNYAGIMQILLKNERSLPITGEDSEIIDGALSIFSALKRSNIKPASNHLEEPGSKAHSAEPNKAEKHLTWDHAKQGEILRGLELGLLARQQ